MCFSDTYCTFHFETPAKRAVSVAAMLPQARSFNEPGLCRTGEEAVQSSRFNTHTLTHAQY